MGSIEFVSSGVLLRSAVCLDDYQTGYKALSHSPNKVKSDTWWQLEGRVGHLVSSVLLGCGDELLAALQPIKLLLITGDLPGQQSLSSCSSRGQGKGPRAAGTSQQSKQNVHWFTG